MIANQSDFREHKRIINDIFYFKEKCLEAFDRDEKLCAIIFDIEKAFDKICHQGLLFKMHTLKITPKIANWIKEFLKNREYYVKVNKQKSENKKIITGLPQSSILLPILFLIYIYTNNNKKL